MKKGLRKALIIVLTLFGLIITQGTCKAEESEVCYRDIQKIFAQWQKSENTCEREAAKHIGRWLNEKILNLKMEKMLEEDKKRFKEESKKDEESRKKSYEYLKLLEDTRLK